MGAILPASDLNTYVRDNFNVLAGGASGYTLGISGGVPAYGVGGWSTITTATLGSDSSIDLQNIPATFSTIKVILYIRDTLNTRSLGSFKINNDSGANYDTQSATGLNASFSGSNTFAGASSTFCSLPGSSGTANNFGYAELTFPNYSGTSNRKPWLSMFTSDPNGAAANIETGFYAGLYLSTSAISRLTFNGAGITFKAGSYYLLLGGV